MPELPGSFSIDKQSFSVWSGNPVTPVQSGDGSYFYGLNAKRLNDPRTMFYLVIWARHGLPLVLVHQSPYRQAGTGQGVLRVQGAVLEASYFEEVGDGKRTIVVPIPEYVPLTPPILIDLPGITAESAVALPALESWPNGGRDYNSMAEVLGDVTKLGVGSLFGDYLRFGLLHTRFNKANAVNRAQHEAIMQIQRLLRKLGALT
jgi:hypothetical protein